MKLSRAFLFVAAISSYAYSQPYEIKFDVISASGWFGGDNRPGQQRNVAVAQSVFVENPILLQSFAFHFSSQFDFAANPTGAGHEVTLRLHIRDSAGSVLRAEQVVVPGTFNGGWVTWSNINLELDGPAKFIFSTYLEGGYDTNQVTSSQTCDLNAGYPGGERYAKYVINDSDAVAWGDWSNHTWDSNFWLIGILRSTDIREKSNLADRFSLEQNYPNPFNPTTNIEFVLPNSGLTELKVYDVLGREVVTLVSDVLDAGTYEATFDAEGFASGVYFYRLHSGDFTGTRKMILQQ